MQRRSAFIGILFLAAFIPITFAQSKTKFGPDEMIENLYKEHKAGSGPFNHPKSRVLVDRYFVKDLADLIWKDAGAPKDEIAAIDFDPLFASQDPQITDFKINKSGFARGAKFTHADKGSVVVTFKDASKNRRIVYAFTQDQAKAWKIYDIRYPDNSSLREIFAALAAHKS